MFNAGVRGKRAKDGVGFLSTAEQFNQKSFLVPTVTSFSITDVSYVPLDNTAVDTAGGETIVINGSGFASGATVQVGATTIGSVTYIDQNRLAFAAPALSSGSYTIYVTNSNGGTGILVSGLVYSGLPTYSTTAGTLGTIYETANINTAVVATGDAPITYSVISGTLPSGATLNSNGTITGNAPVDGSSTTYSFTIQASDAQLQDSTRAFTLTINTDVLTWGLANNTVYSLDGGTAMSNVTLSATSAANSNSAVTFAANTLPTGVSLSGNTIFGTPTTEQTVYSTLTATATQTGRTATRFVSWVVSVSDLFFKYTTLAIQGADTTFVDDASTNNFAVTIAGDTKPNSFNPYTPGYYSNYFDGSGDYLTFPTTSGKLDYTGDFTTEMWIYWVSMPTTGYDDIYGNNSVNGSYILGTSNSSTVWAAPYILRLYIAGYGDVINGNTVLTASQWYHIAHTRSSGVNRLFVNGVLQTNTYTDSTSRSFGSSGVNLANNSNAYVSNFRFLQGTALYTTTFTPPSAPLTAIANTSLLTCQSNRFIDNSTNAYTITKAGDVAIKSFSPFTPNSSYSTYGSGYFDGTGDYLTVPYNSALNLGSDTTWTMEYWVYFNAAFGTYTPISFVQSSLLRWNMEHAASTTLLLFNNSTAVTFTNPSTLTPSNWYHIAWVRNGTTVRMYINGVASSTTSTNNLQTISSGPLSIGYNALGGYEFYMNGYISNVRLVKGVAVYTGAFTPPTSPLQATQSAGTNIAAITGTSTSLLTLQTNQPVNNNIFLDNSTNNFLVTRNGNATQGTFSPYGGNWSNYFGGQMVSTLSPSSTKFNLTGDFTLEAYVFLTALPGGDWGILDARTAGASPTSWLFGFNGSGKMQYYDGTARVGATTITLNTWHHVSWVRNGSVLRAYLNGVLDYYNGSYGTSAISPGSTAPVIGTKDYGISAAWGTTGYISNLRVVNGTAVYTTSSTTVGTTIFTPSTTPLTPIANTTLLTCADSRFIDDSVNNYTITPSSTTISAQRFSPFSPSSVTPTSYSGYFDGTGDYLLLATSPATNITTGSFTIECWVNVPSITAYMYLFGTTNSVGGRLVGRIASSTTVTIQDSGGTTTFTVPTIVLNTWNHIVWVRSGSSTTVFVNGVRSSTGAVTNTTSYTQIVQIGAHLTNYFTGYISNFRIVVGTAVYDPTQSTITVPTSPLTAISGTSLLTCQSPTFIDNSTNNFTITAAGNSQPTIQNPFGFTSATTNGYTPSTIGGSGYFDGTGDYLSTPSLISASGDFTIECWFNTTIAVSGFRMLCGGNIDASASNYLGINASGVEAQFGSGSATVVTAAYTFVPNTWYHVAMTRSGTTIRIFVNGVSLTTSQGSQAGTFSVRYIAIGYTGITYTGYIADLRFVVGTSIYTSNFVPPSAPLTAVQNTALLTNMTSAGIYDAAMMTTMETVGDAKLSTAVSKFGGSSMVFDGTGDYLKAPYNLAYSLPGDFTVETWIYLTSAAGTGNQTIASFGYNNSTGAGPWGFYLNGNGPYTLYFNSTPGNHASTTTVAIPINTWTHVTYCRSGSTGRFFVNGTIVGTAISDSFTYTGTTESLFVGIMSDASSAPLYGHLDDLRITKGYARYTANFTAPITTFKIK